MPVDRKGYDMALIIVDRFAKRTFSIPCFKNIDAKELAWLFIYYVYRIYGLLDLIVSD